VIPICTSSLNAWVMFNVGRSGSPRICAPHQLPPGTKELGITDPEPTPVQRTV